MRTRIPLWAVVLALLPWAGLALAQGIQSGAIRGALATLAITATSDLGTVTTDGAGAGAATVRSGAKCFCFPVNDATLPACVVSGTTLSITGASSLVDVNYFCPTTR